MRIFIADYLPIKNKGEEALLRGIQSLYEEKYQEDVQFYVFGQCDEITQDGNIISFPVKWCYPTYKYPSAFTGRKGLVRRLICALLFRIGFYPYVKRVSEHKEFVSALSLSDKILLAHDGFYHVFCAGLGLYLNKLGYHYSVPGAGFKPISKYSFFYKGLDFIFFKKSEYNVFREQTCYDYVQNLRLSKESYLLPDMAFYCQSTEYEIELSKSIIKKYKIGDNNEHICIGLTMCENSISFRGSFLNSVNKSDTHRNFIANLLDNISDKINCFFYFLPHCIENGPGNDLVIAEDIIKRMLNKNVVIIQEDLPVNILRPVIQNFDFVLGERTHSIINSTSMCTPYFMLTSTMDFRSHDIIGKGIGLPNQIIDLDNPNLSDLTLRIIEGINNRETLKKHLISYKRVVSESRSKLINLI